MIHDQGVRRLLLLFGVLAVISLATSLYRGDSLQRTVGLLLAGLIGGGLVLASYTWARRDRKDAR